MERNLRTASILALIDKSNSKELGKIQLQKLVYFLQVAGVPLGYSYEIYHYGPYSFELASEIGSLDSLGILDVTTDPNGYGFHIRPGTFNETYDFNAKYLSQLEKVTKTLASNSASQLEVKATLHFVRSVMEKRSKPTDSEVINKVKALKPHYTEKFILGCLNELKNTNWLN